LNKLNGAKALENYGKGQITPNKLLMNNILRAKVKA